MAFLVVRRNIRLDEFTERYFGRFISVDITGAVSNLQNGRIKIALEESLREVVEGEQRVLVDPLTHVAHHVEVEKGQMVRLRLVMIAQFIVQVSQLGFITRRLHKLQLQLCFLLFNSLLVLVANELLATYQLSIVYLLSWR